MTGLNIMAGYRKLSGHALRRAHRYAHNCVIGTYWTGHVVGYALDRPADWC
jgi:hypothetical protein